MGARTRPARGRLCKWWGKRIRRLCIEWRKGSNDLILYVNEEKWLVIRKFKYLGAGNRKRGWNTLNERFMIHTKGKFNHETFNRWELRSWILQYERIQEHRVTTKSQLIYTRQLNLQAIIIHKFIEPLPETIMSAYLPRWFSFFKLVSLIHSPICGPVLPVFFF